MDTMTDQDSHRRTQSRMGSGEEDFSLMTIPRNSQNEYLHCDMPVTQHEHDEEWITLECQAPGCEWSRTFQKDFPASVGHVLKPTPEVIEQAKALAANIEDATLRAQYERVIIASKMAALNAPPPEPKAEPAPKPVVNPLGLDSPKETLLPEQRQLLLSKWSRDGFGKKYHDGIWSSCEQETKNHVIRWLKMPEQSFIIIGSMGTGKTTLLGMIMASMTARNINDYVYQETGELFDFLHRYDPDNQEHAHVYSRLAEAKYLILDDVGTEYSADWSGSRFQRLIERRYKNGLHHILTTNLSESKLRQHHNWERAIDRIAENVAWTEIGGKSRRVTG